MSALARRLGGHAAARDESRRLPPAWAITAAFGLLYVIAAPASSDLAAAGYRSDLFSRAGFTLWDNGWYGGHHLLAYSVLAPGLGALLGPELLNALSMTLAAALFGVLVDGLFPVRASRIAALWFALGAAVGLLANRVPFDLGVALGLAALVAARSAGARGGRAALALALAALCALASPVAGAFLALAAIAWLLGAANGWFALALALAAVAPIALLAIAFPEGGSQPFVASAFYPALAAVLLIAAAIPPQERVLRSGALLYALALLGAYLIPTAVGGNVDRLGSLVAGPVLACALAGRSSTRADGAGGRSPRAPLWRARALIALAPLLLYWQFRAPIADFASAASDRSSSASYYTPLLAELRRLGVGYGARPARVEVLPTRDHAEARWMAVHVMIARGWERQLDTDRNALLYERSTPLSATRYRAWLSEDAISYVALPDSPLDYSARAEARLLRAAPGYLREVWRAAHWRLFEVRGAAALTQPPSVLTQLSSDSFTLHAPSAGAFTVRVRFTPYWALTEGRGCVRRAAGDWTRVQARGGGSLHVAIDFSPARVFEHGPRCR